MTNIAVCQRVRPSWQTFQNGRIVNANRMDQRRRLDSDIQSSSVINVDTRSDLDIHDSFDQNPNDVEFDTPSEEIDEFFEQFFDDLDFTDFKSPIVSMDSDSIQILSGTGDISLNSEGTVDLSDIAHNAKLEHELLFGNPFKDFQAQTQRDIQKTPQRQNNAQLSSMNLRKQINMQVEEMKMPSRTNSLGRQPVQVSPTSNQVIPRMRPLPLQIVPNLRNMSVDGLFPRYPLLLLMNNSTINTGGNKFEQRKEIVRGPNTEILSMKTTNNAIRNGNRHISRSNVRVSFRNSTRTFSAVKSLPRDVKRIVQFSNQGQPLRLEIQRGGRNKHQGQASSKRNSKIHPNGRKNGRQESVSRNNLQVRPMNNNHDFFRGNNIQRQSSHNQRQLQRNNILNIGAKTSQIDQSFLHNTRHLQRPNIVSPQITNGQAHPVFPGNQRHLERNNFQRAPSQQSGSNPVFLANQRQVPHQLLRTSPVLNRLHVIPSAQRQITSRFQAHNRPFNTRSNTLDTPGITRQQQIALEAVRNRNMLFQRIMSQRPNQDQMSHFLRQNVRFSQTFRHFSPTPLPFRQFRNPQRVRHQNNFSFRPWRRHRRFRPSQRRFFH